MNSERRYLLEPYKGLNTRYRCPIRVTLCIKYKSLSSFIQLIELVFPDGGEYVFLPDLRGEGIARNTDPVCPAPVILIVF